MKVTKTMRIQTAVGVGLLVFLVFLFLKNSLFTTFLGLALLSIGLLSYGIERQNNIYMSATVVYLIGLFLIHTQYNLDMIDILISAVFLIALTGGSVQQYYKRNK